MKNRFRESSPSPRLARFAFVLVHGGSRLALCSRAKEPQNRRVRPTEHPVEAGNGVEVQSARCANPQEVRAACANTQQTGDSRHFTTLTISCALLPFQCDLGSLPVLWIDGGGYQI